MTIIFGQFTTKFTGFVSSNGSEQAAQEFRENVDHFVLWFVYLFAARFVVVYISNVTVSIAAIRTTRTIRRTFLEKTLRQEIWHFDKQSIGSVSSQVTTSKLFPSIAAYNAFFPYSDILLQMATASTKALLRNSLRSGKGSASSFPLSSWHSQYNGNLLLSS